MLIQFTLSMPANNASSGIWTGYDNFYAIVRTMRAAQSKPILERATWRFAFGDGWVAEINAKKINAAEARKVREKSRGFCGHDWMVESILRHNEIHR